MVVTSLTKVTVGIPLQLSVAVTSRIFAGGTFEEQVTVTAGGQVRVGGV